MWQLVKLLSVMLASLARPPVQVPDAPFLVQLPAGPGMCTSVIHVETRMELDSCLDPDKTSPCGYLGSKQANLCLPPATSPPLCPLLSLCLLSK